MNSPNDALVLTIGHSTRTLDEFLALLKMNEVTMVVDIRTIPRSRHNPQFNTDTLPASLNNAGINYIHMAGLGGLRHPRPDSLNGSWRNASFRGFADHMQTAEFEQNLQHLINLSKVEMVALMCAEAVPWRCHRSLIADALLMRGIRVEHILNSSARRLHTLNPWAEVRGTTITYPSPAGASASVRNNEAT